MLSVSRVFGLLTPILLIALGLWLKQEGLLPIDGPEGAVLGMVAVGVVSGMLLRTRWAVVYAPAVILTISGIGSFVLEAFGPDQPASADRTPWIVSMLILAIFGLLPLAAGTAFGAAIGKLVEDRRTQVTT